jgi:ATP-dependent protease ClpP protease subunit
MLSNRANSRPSNSAPTVVVKDTTATIRLYDPIDDYGGWWGMSAAEMADAVDELPSKVTDIRLLINSPGGDVFDGMAIMNVLSAHPARVTAVVQGLAASAASFIAVGVDELVMNPGSMLMIHDASTGVYGWASDMREVADLLDKISDNIASMYARKAGGENTDWRDLMRAETWYTADEAVTAGLADRVQATSEADAPADADPADSDPDPFLDRLLTADQVRSHFGLPESADPLIDAHTGDDDANRIESGLDGRDRDLLALLDI